jgi:cell division protein FtsX
MDAIAMMGCARFVQECDMSNSVLEELREMAWLASMIAGLSVVGVGLAVMLAAASA